MSSQKQINKFGLMRYLLSLPGCNAEKIREYLTIFENVIIKDASLRGFENSGIKEYLHVPFIRCTFDNVNFRNMNIYGLRFHNTHFKNCNFSKSIMRRCFASHCVFENCKFNNSSFREGSITKSLIIKSNFSQTYFDEEHLSSNIFVNTKFEDATLNAPVRRFYFHDASNIFMKCNFNNAKLNSGTEKTVFHDCSMREVLFKNNLSCVTFSGTTSVKLNHHPMNMEHEVKYIFVGEKCTADAEFYNKIKLKDTETIEGLSLRNAIPDPPVILRDTGFSMIFPYVGITSANVDSVKYDTCKFATSRLIPSLVGTNNKKDSIYKIFIIQNAPAFQSLEIIAQTITQRNGEIVIDEEPVCEFSFNWFIKNSDRVLQTMMNKLKELSGMDPIESIKLKNLTDKEHEMQSN